MVGKRKTAAPWQARIGAVLLRMEAFSVNVLQLRCLFRLGITLASQGKTAVLLAGPVVLGGKGFSVLWRKRTVKGSLELLIFVNMNDVIRFRLGPAIFVEIITLCHVLLFSV